MNTNFKKFLAMTLAVLMVMSAFSTLATAADQSTCVHEWEEYGDNPVVDPTCTEDGFTWIKCKLCHKVDIKDVKPATGHTPGEWIVDVQPGCEHREATVTGEKHKECTVCHVWIDLNEKDLAEGETIATKIVNDEEVEYVIIPELKANMINKYDESAKCGENCLVYEQCINPGGNPGGICGFTKNHKNDIKKHNYVVVGVKQEPTCQVYGIMLYACNQTYIENGETKTCGATVEVKINKLDCKNHEVVSETAATCTATGSREMKCNDCGATWTEELAIDSTNHTGLSAAATCTQAQVCSACNATVVGALNHPEKYLSTETNDATCTADGSVVVTCTLCNTVVSTTVLPATGHGDYTVIFVSAPTCGKDAVLDITCNACGYKVPDTEWKTWENIVGWQAPADHNYVGVETPATCTEDGYTTYTCSICGDTYTEEGTEAAGHMPPKTPDGKLDASKITWTHKVDESGDTSKNCCLAAYKCTVCGADVTDDARFHREGLTVEVIVEATCTTYGTSFDFCKYCGYTSSTYSVPPMNHQGFEEPVPGTPATCAKDGCTDGVKCSSCGEWIEEPEVISKDTIPHGSFYLPIIAPSGIKDAEGNDLVFKKPTCTEAGSWYMQCEVCGDWVDATNNYNPGKWDALDHDYDAVVTAPTCTEDGYTTYTCSICGDSYTADPVGKLGHTPKDPVRENEVPNTCITDGGYDTVVYCDVCGTEISREHTVVPANPNAHPVYDSNLAYFVVTLEPTCTTGGEATVFCDMCDTADEHRVSYDTPGISEVLKKRLAPKGHGTMTVVYVSATCTTEGSMTFTCNVCNELIDEMTVVFPVKPDAHPADKLHFHEKAIMQNGKGYARTPSCASNGLLWYYCDACAAADDTGAYQGFTVTEEGSKMDCHDDIKNLTFDKENSVAPSCTEEGVNAYYCKHPHYVVYWDTTKNAYVEATRECPYTYEETIPASNHNCSKTLKTNGHWSGTCAAPADWDVFCDGCGYQFPDEEWQSWGLYTGWEQKPHTIVPDKGYAATCTATGLTDGEHCTKCDYKVEQEEIPANGHGDYTVIFVSGPDCLNNAKFKITCNACGYEVPETEWQKWEGIVGWEALDHNYVPVVTKPTCTDKGYTTYTCSRCGDSYEADEVPANGHGDYTVVYVGGPTCLEDAKLTITCNACGYVVPETEWQKWENIVGWKALGHDIKKVDAQAPDCTNVGWDAYEYCTRCDYTTYVEKKALGHLPWEMNEHYQCVDDMHKHAPTCTEDGLGWGSICQRCGECAENHKVIPAYGHNYETDVFVADCEHFGFTYTICRWCGDGWGYAESVDMEYADASDSIIHISQDELNLWAKDDVTADDADDAFVPGSLAVDPSAWNHIVTYELGQYVALNDWGWIALNNADDFVFGYIVDNGYPVMDEAYTFEADQGVVDAGNSLGALQTTRFNGMLDVTELGVGEHNVKFVMEQNGVYTIIREYTVVVTSADGAEAEEVLHEIPGIIMDYVPEGDGHAFLPGFVKVPATCTTPGEICKKCLKCGYETAFQNTKPLGHDIPDHKTETITTKEVECARCGVMVDAHEEHYVTEEDLIKYENISKDICREVLYDLTYCVDCGYKFATIHEINDRAHSYVETSRTDATVTGDGLVVETCENCGDVKETVLPAITDTIVLDYTIGSGSVNKDGEFVFTEQLFGEDGALTAGKIVNGGKVAIAIDMTALNVEMTQIMISVGYNSDLLVFNEDLTKSVNDDNGFVNEYLATVGENAVVKAISSSTTAVTITPEGKDYLVLVFDVKTTAYEADKASINASFELVSNEVINGEANPVEVSADTNIGTAVISKNADVDGNGTFGLADVQKLMDIWAAKGYDEQADIDCDGDVDLRDLVNIQKILLNEGVNADAYVQILDGTYEAA